MSVMSMVDIMIHEEDGFVSRAKILREAAVEPYKYSIHEKVDEGFGWWLDKDEDQHYGTAKEFIHQRIDDIYDIIADAKRDYGASWKEKLPVILGVRMNDDLWDYTMDLVTCLYSDVGLSIKYTPLW